MPKVIMRRLPMRRRTGRDIVLGLTVNSGASVSAMKAAMEELVAELGAAFVSADLGLTPEVRDDHASYIASWLKVVKTDKWAISTAASHAQRAADFLNAFCDAEAVAQAAE